MSTKPKVASIPPKMYKASDEASNFSSDGNCRRLTKIQGIDPSQEKKSTNTASETQDNAAKPDVVTKTEDSPIEAAAKALVLEYMDRYANVYNRDPSQEKNSTNTAPETQDNAANSDAVTKTEDSPEEVAAKVLVLEYMDRYANVYSEELLFAIDVMSLVRYLNNLEIRYIIYPTSANPTSSTSGWPISPCDDLLDEAIRKMWVDLDKGHGHKLEAAIKKRNNHHLFQELILRLAEAEEEEEWDNEKTFLRYCLVLAQLAVCAERNGLTDASEFIPLVICRTIQKRKDSGQFPVNIWERIAKLALDITDGSESP